MRHTMRRGTRRLNSWGRRGFALIEMIIAFAILALGVGTIMVGIVVAMRSDAQARTSRTMVRIAQSRLEEAGITSKLEVGRREGKVGQFTWRETVAPVTIGRDGRKEKQAQEAGAPILPVWVEIVVRAVDGHEEKLSALKLAPKVAK